MAHGNRNASEDAKDCEWYTPLWFYEAIAVPIDLDPCHPIEKLPWSPAKKVYNILDDGLAQPWAGFVYMNPPYGKAIVPWYKRLIAHGDGLALVPSATETGWWQEFASAASMVLFPQGRINFWGRDMKPRLNKEGKKSSNGLGSSVIAFGPSGIAACYNYMMSRPATIFKSAA